MALELKVAEPLKGFRRNARILTTQLNHTAGIDAGMAVLFRGRRKRLCQ